MSLQLRSRAGLAVTWLRSSKLGLVALAMTVGVGAGLGAVAFRWLIFGFTWLATGHQQFGQQGRVGSLHLPWLGTGFVMVVPVIAGLLYGPLIQRYAREARGHGVPEVMLAVAENGGRIRPQVTVVKALASAMCIGGGGSVGREGPIVQIGSAFASSLGQWVRISESRLRIIVACGAAGGIAATFNAPVTGLFFGFEIVLRELSLDAMLATTLSAVTADLVSRAAFGSAPFFNQIPHDLTMAHPYDYLLVGLLGLAAGLVGLGFKTFLYGLEDLMDRLWKGRPEWARPAVGGVLLGLVLLAIPQLYGVGYPVMDKIISGQTVLWLVVVLMFGKILAASVTLSIGGSGGVFAPSLFTGAAGGMAFGTLVHHLFGAAAGPPAVYAVIAMGAVFSGAAQAPLTSIASVVEMTGNFGLTLPVMLAVGVSAGASKALSYGSIYTTKLLRRGIDIERPKTTSALQLLKVADVMNPLSDASRDGGAQLPLLADRGPDNARSPGPVDGWAKDIGPMTDARRPQALFADEVLADALRQLVLYGRNGLPVVSRDLQHLLGWVTRQDVLRALAERVGASAREAEQGSVAAEIGAAGARERAHAPRTPLEGYDLVEITLRPGAPAIGRRLGDMVLPAGSMVVAVTVGREIAAPCPDLKLETGERLVLLVPTADTQPSSEPAGHLPPALR